MPAFFCVSHILAHAAPSSCSFSQNILSNMAVDERADRTFPPPFNFQHSLLQHQHNELDTNWNILSIQLINNNKNFFKDRLFLYNNDQDVKRSCCLSFFSLRFWSIPNKTFSRNTPRISGSELNTGIGWIKYSICAENLLVNVTLIHTHFIEGVKHTTGCRRQKYTHVQL